MVSSRKKKPSSRRFLSQLDGFDQNNVIGNTLNNRQDHARVNEGTSGQQITIDNPGTDLAANENLVNV